MTSSEQVIPEGYRSGTILDAFIAAEAEDSENLIACFLVRLDGFAEPAEGEELGAGDVECEHKMYGKPEGIAKTRAIFESLGLAYPDDSVEIAPRTIGKRVRVGTFHNPKKDGNGVFVNHYIVLGKGKSRARVSPEDVARVLTRQAGDDPPFGSET